MTIASKNTTKEEFIKEYQNYPDVFEEGMQPHHMTRIRPILLEINDNSSVLDVGCNTGAVMQMLLNDKKGMTVKGIEISPSLVEKAREKGLDVVKGDCQELPYPNDTFDYVILMEVLSHIHDPSKSLSEIRRVLKKDGVLLGSCPHKNLEMNVWDDKRLHHEYYTTESLESLLHQYFDGVQMKSFKGGQFAVGLSGSYLAGKEVEILFKCGKKDLPSWDWQLKRDDVLKVWFAPTQAPGDVYYRMTGYAEKMNKLEKTDILYSHFSYADPSGPGSWQNAFRLKENKSVTNPMIVDQMDSMLKVADVSVWQLTSTGGVLAYLHALKEIRKKPIVTEIDDWLFDVPSYNIASHPYQPNSDFEWIAYKQIEISDALIVSTRFIGDHLREIFPNKQVYVVPNCIDFDLWDNVKKPERNNDHIVIGYTGCSNHSGDMSIVKEPLLKLLEEFPNLYVVMPVNFKSWESVNHPRVKKDPLWVLVREFPQVVANWTLDIGIAPLKDSNFNRAKSNLRWLEYSALKIPTVASKVYPFEKTIIEGADGYICNNKLEWYETLKRLIQDKELRQKIGNQAYKRVKEEFNMDIISRKYRTILQGIKEDWSKNL